jgi:uncharacterized protein (TIGR03083 family)
MLRFFRDLDAREWQVPSRAPGWRVQDVLAHIGSSCKAVFTPSLLKLITSRDIESTNDVFVAQWRDRSPLQVLTEYERWSKRVIALAGCLLRTPAYRLRIPLAELGRFPAGLVLTGAMVFDHHTHLRHDIAPALGRTAPDTDAVRMEAILEWMFAVLAKQLQSARSNWLTRSIAITLNGPGGGTWHIQPGGLVTAAPAHDAVAEIAGLASEFPEWATRRAAWREYDVRITGDVDFAALFLDQVNVI